MQVFPQTVHVSVYITDNCFNHNKISLEPPYRQSHTTGGKPARSPAFSYFFRIMEAKSPRVTLASEWGRRLPPTQHSGHLTSARTTLCAQTQPLCCLQQSSSSLYRCLPFSQINCSQWRLLPLLSPLRGRNIRLGASNLGQEGVRVWVCMELPSS